MANYKEPEVWKLKDVHTIGQNWTSTPVLRAVSENWMRTSVVGSIRMHHLKLRAFLPVLMLIPWPHAGRNCCFDGSLVFEF